MAKITSWAGRYTGLVTYNDNTKKSFNVMANDHSIWSTDQVGSRDAESDVKWYFKPGIGWLYYARENILWRGLALAGAGSLLDGVFHGINSKITDAVFSISMTFTTDDGKIYPVTAVYDRKGGYYYQDTPDLFSSASNANDYRVKIENMLLSILSIAHIA
jgi:major membrane immunogen (membrane-anchored lipoprotein)